MTDTPAPVTPRTEQIIQFIYRMREPDTVRPDEERTLRHLLDLLQREAAAPAATRRDFGRIFGEIMRDYPEADARLVNDVIRKVWAAAP